MKPKWQRWGEFVVVEPLQPPFPQSTVTIATGEKTLAVSKSDAAKLEAKFGDLKALVGGSMTLSAHDGKRIRVTMTKGE